MKQYVIRLSLSQDQIKSFFRRSSGDNERLLY